jgi:hypothetical protein
MNQNLPTEAREIGAHTYTVTRLGFANARKLLELSEQLLGPAILSLLAGVDPQAAMSSLLGTDLRSAGEAILGVLGRLGSSKADEVFRLLGAHTRVVDEGKLIVLTETQQDQWWALHPDECIAWLAFAYEVQFRDFFVGAGRHLNVLFKKAGA